MAEQIHEDLDLLDRYVQRRLSDDVMARMELWILDRPESLEVLELAAGLREGMSHLDGRLLLQDARREQHSEPPAPRPSWWVPVFSALAITVLVLGGQLVRSDGRIEALQEELAVATSPTTAVVPIRLELTRGGSDEPDARVELEDRPKLLMFEIPVQAWPHVPRFDVVWRQRGRRDEQKEVAATEKGIIRYAINSGMLKEGVFEIVVRSKDEELVVFRVEVVKD